MRCVKKPVEIQAMQYKGTNAEEVLKFCGKNADYATTDEAWENTIISKNWINVHTLEGDVRADVGDYIIKGVAGEFYPCSKETFKKTYDHKKGKSYVKKPIVSNCIVFDGNNALDVAAFCAENNCELPSTLKDTLVFNNGKDMLVATAGDYIIVGLNGNAYPCKPDIFEKTYEEAIPEWVERLGKEIDELDAKTHALETLLTDTDAMNVLKQDTIELNLLIGQLGAMKAYQSILNARHIHYFEYALGEKDAKKSNSDNME